MQASKLEILESELADQAWSVQTDFFDHSLIQSLKQTALDYKNQDLFNSAKIGQGPQARFNPAVRSDQTYWIQAQHSQAERVFWQEMEQIRLHLNQALMLGLFEYEAHFAHYAKGSFYQKHLDRFQAQASRRVSTVVYLNDTWQSQDGGELVLYDKQDQMLAQIMPTAGTLVSFLSDAIPHEVKPANRERWSIAGWFRTRS
ncbi:MAG: 2OG-Fe(II) oxygenase [Gammaproteobacteria bacterium]|jgi:SM-20-related protein|nr:2OG-Fe(II) oxygenase [Gammaproteobacteria bacterium]